MRCGENRWIRPTASSRIAIRTPRCVTAALAIGCAHGRDPDDVRGCTDPGGKAKLQGAGSLSRRACRDNGWGMVPDGPDSASAAGQGQLPSQSWPGPLTGVGARNLVQEATRARTASSRKSVVRLLRLLRPQPLRAARWAALWHTWSLLNRYLHSITLMQAGEQILRRFKLHTVAIRPT